MQQPLTPVVLTNHAPTALIAGAIGGILGAGVRWVEQRLERQRRRQAVATALLDDLRTVELDARQLVEQDYPAQRVSRSAERLGRVFRRVAGGDDLYLSQAGTVSRVLHVATLLLSLEDLGAAYPGAGESARPLLQNHVRAKAWFLAKQIAAVKAALRRGGGALPPAEAIQSLDGFELPALGAPAFAEWTQTERPSKRGVWPDARGRPRPDTPGAPPAPPGVHPSAEPTVDSR